MDSSALIAAAISATGAARELVRLAVNEEIELVISEDVVLETRRNISGKAAELLPLLDRLRETIEPEIARTVHKLWCRFQVTCYWPI